MNTLYTGSFICVFLSYFKQMKLNSLFLILSLLLLFTISSAAAISFTLDSQVNISNNAGDSQTPQIKTSGSDVYVVWKDNTSGSNNILFKKSSDNGATFGSVVTLDTGGANSQDPQVSSSGSNVYSVWQEGTSPAVIEFAKSSNSGGTFSGPVTLSSSTTVSNSQIASSSSDVYVTWQQNNVIYFSGSGDSGDNFNAPISLSGASSGKPKLALSGNNVYVVWKEGSDIYFIKSADNGGNFGTKINLSNSVTTSQDPDVVASGTGIYVIWKEGTDIYFAQSTNSGTSFSSPVDIGDTGGTSTPNPKIAFDGTIYVIWSETVSGKGDISFRSSTDGVSFTAKQNLSSNTGSSITPEIAADSGNVVVTWQDDTPGNNEIFIKSSDDSGATFGSVQNISSNAGFSLTPKVSLEGTRSSFVWEDTTPAGGVIRDVLFRTGTPSSISVSFDNAQYTLNESAQITVNDPLSSGSIDVTVTSTSDSGGLLVTLAETGVGTGIFQGTVTFDDVTTASAIKAKAGDTITASFGGQSSDATIFPITIEVQILGIDYTAFAYGDITTVQVEDKNSNQDSLVAEKINVTVKSTRDTTGITLALTETGPNTGIFTGTLIFMDGNDLVTSSQSITISQTDATKNTNHAAIDTSTISVKSTSDAGGISFDLVETGVNTDKFENKLTLTSSTSVPNSAINAVAGDIISITSSGFTSNTIVTPSPGKGGISVKFDAIDTVTVSYLAKSHSVTVEDKSDSGGGGGGLVRPGLVVNALAGGSGSSASGPLISLNNLLGSTIHLPLEVEQDILNHNANTPIPPMSLDTYDDFDFPLVINDKGFVLGGFENTLQTQSIKTNTPVTIKFTVYESLKIQHFSLYTNLRGDKDTIAQSDTQILYNDGKDIKIIDPHGFFDGVKVTINKEENSPKKFVVFDVTFANTMDTTDIIIRTWDPMLNSWDTIIKDAIKVESAEPEFILRKSRLRN